MASTPGSSSHSSRPFIFPHAAEPCLCNSGKTFSDCCGSLRADRSPPVGIYIAPNAINDTVCQMVVDIAENNEKKWLTTLERNPASGEFEFVPDRRRVTQSVVMNENFLPINELVGSTWVNVVQPTIERAFEWFEQPMLLCYFQDGKYDAHADAENYNDETGRWERSIDRDWSLLLYVNDGFEGGAIHFPNFNYRYQPKKGDLVFFPSDHRYLHQAEAVTSGVRYAVVSWAALKDGPRCSGEMTPNAIGIRQ